MNKNKCPICKRNFSFKFDGSSFCKKCQYRCFSDGPDKWEEVIFSDINIYVANYTYRNGSPKKCTIIKSSNGRISQLNNRIILEKYNLDLSTNIKEIKNKLKYFLTFS